MKSIFRYIIFAVVVFSSVLAACSKDTAVEGNSGTAEGNQGLRTITLSFSSDTKVAFSGTKAEFQNGDVIKVANATESKDETVNVSGGIASITTSLTGNLTAVFPSTAANVTGNGPLGSPQFKVKAQQNGTSGDAVIAVAQIEGMNAVFKLQTALFQITPPSTATKIIIKSLSPVVGGVARTGTAADITDDSDGIIITVGDGSTSLSSPIYVALKPGVKLTDLSFDAGKTIGIKGIPANKLDSNPDETVARGKYTIDNTNWHPYVTIGGKKWATRNVGATADTGTYSYGKYFMWGETTGLTSDKISSTNFPNTKYYSADNTSWSRTAGFGWANCPWTNGAYNTMSNKRVFTKYVPSDKASTLGSGGTYSDTKIVLDLADDAAYANWGGPWRMPTGGTAATADFTTLANACNSGGYSSGTLQATRTTAEPTSQGVYNYNVNGGKGIYFVDGSGNKLFFPAAGSGAATSLSAADSKGFYWSSSLRSDNPISAYKLNFDGNNVEPQESESRFNGYSIRPVADL